MSNFIKTFGCRLNTFETEIIKSFIETNKIKNLSVVNTCAVTQEAEKKAVREIKKIKNKNKDTFLVVTGCAAQLRAKSFENMSEVDLVLGNQEKLISGNWSKINNLLKTNKRNFKSNLVSNIMKENTLPSNKLIPSKSNTRAFLGIQNGCDHRCTFCIIPYARGNSRSITKSEIKKQIETLVLNGIKEVVLTGVDITSWGLDFEKKERLGDLICFILNSIPSLERLRISSIDSIEIDPRLMDLLCYETRLMPHLHLSLQSGDNMILKRMKRRHSREDTIKFCSLLKKIRPRMTFSADIIAGFPTENEEMFQNTISIIEQCKIDWIHVFPYSSRTGTPASKMPQVPKMEIDKRASILRKISNERLNKHLKNKIGSIQKVLVEGNAKGFTEDYSRVSFEEGPEIGEIINMKIEKKYNNELFGIPIN
tara:strand:+ start:2857 stop:4128 length:1272 start_codon:yes stop_codon:yes gene_type:complete